MDRGFKDSTPYENHGTATDVTLGADRKGNTKAGVFNGTSSYIDCGNNSSLDITGAITMSAWIKRTSIGAVHRILHKGGQSNVALDYTFGFGTSNTVFFYASKSNSSTVGVRTNKTYTTNEWLYIVGTYNGTTYRIYVNGVEMPTTEGASGTNTSTSSLFIGARNDGDQHMNGYIDDVRIYNRALSQEEITKLYESYNPCLKLYGGDKEIKKNGFIRVDKNINNSIYFDNPESNLYGKTYFYVMQYQARNNGGVPQSTGDGLPWVSISQLDAIQKSKDAGYHLITNWEWMAIARDIEQVPENWTGGAVGSGILKRGNVGTPDAGSYDGDNPETGILNSKAILKLSNGEEIYHLSGNVWEWVDDKIECGATSCPSSLMPYASTPASEWVEFTNISTWGKYTKAELGPLGNYNSANGVGKIYTDYDAAAGSSDIYTHAFRRGGDWNNGAYAGVFALDLNNSPTNLNTNIGFRYAR
jgi:hypothetical protein